MWQGSADQRVLGYLGRALSLELTAVQQYSTQARLAAAWGLTDAAGRLRAEADDEMGHVDRIVARMLALGCAPGASQLRPVRLGKSLVELLQADQSMETDIQQLYAEAVTHCTRIADHDNRVFFQAILDEERSHGEELARWIDELTSPTGASAPQRATF